jgi:hypothetical protein
VLLQYFFERTIHGHLVEKSDPRATLISGGALINASQ